MSGADERWALVGNIRTMEDSGPTARVVVVEGEQIIGVGDEALEAQISAAGVRIVDVGDRTVVPGFIDPHAHLEIACRAAVEMVDCRAPRHATVDDVLQTLHENLWRAERGGWLVGQANLFFDQKLTDKRLPTREELDSVSRDVSIVLRAGGHTSVLNSRGFETSDVVRYAGGQGMMGGAVIERDSTGAPTGVISELDKVLPLPEPSTSELEHAIIEGSRKLFTGLGVTGVGEISESTEGLLALDRLISADSLPIRLRVLLWAPGTMSFDEGLEWRERTPFQSPASSIDVVGIKLFADGGYSARNAATLTEYKPPYAVTPGSRGQINLASDVITDAFRRTQEKGLQLAVHANGERAQHEVCHGIIASGITQLSAPPPRIEHAGNIVTSSETTDLWTHAGIIPVPQAVFLYNFGDFFPVYLGEPGKRGRFAFRTLMDQGWQLSSSSDVLLGSEEEQTNPLFNMWCALKRQTFFGDIVDSEQQVTRTEALQMVTINAARCLGREKLVGSIASGKLADLVVLEDDPCVVDVDRLRGLAVDEVYLAGKRVHTRGAAPELHV